MRYCYAGLQPCLSNDDVAAKYSKIDAPHAGNA